MAHLNHYAYLKYCQLGGRRAIRRWGGKGGQGQSVLHQGKCCHTNTVSGICHCWFFPLFLFYSSCFCLFIIVSCWSRPTRKCVWVLLLCTLDRRCFFFICKQFICHMADVLSWWKCEMLYPKFAINVTNDISSVLFSANGALQTELFQFNYVVF